MIKQQLKEPLILVGALVFGLPLLKQLSNKQQLIIAQRTESERQQYNVNCIKGTPPNQTRYTINLVTIASLIYDAFYNSDIFGFTEDEAKAIAELKKVPKTKIALLASLYNANTGKDLRKDFIRFLDSDQYAKVSNLLS
jgi:hypothetical protein